MQKQISELFDGVVEGLAEVFNEAGDEDRQEIAQLIEQRMDQLRGLIAEQAGLTLQAALPLSAVKPPTLWLERQDRTKTPPDFIKEVYAEWLGHGLTQAHIRRVDMSLYTALHKWLKTNNMPDDLDLPTRKEMNDRLLQQHGIPSPTEAWGAAYRAIDPATKEKLRLYSLVQKRERRGSSLPEPKV